MRKRILRLISISISVSMLCVLFLVSNSINVQAAAYYEPMIVSSGYNYDVIATSGETPSYTESLDASCGTRAGTNYACFYSQSLYSTGGFPTSRIISSESTSGLTWQLGSYTSANALKLNPGGYSGTLTFSKIGCYQKVYILSVAGGLGAGNSATMQATINYTDGTTSTSTFEVRDWWDNVSAATKIYRRYCNGYSSNTNCGSTSGAPYLTQSVMTVNTTKLIKSITFKNMASSGSGMYLSILAVTGLTANVSVPTLQTSTELRTTRFTVNWNDISDAASYRIDVATDSSFSNILADYNNKAVTDNYCVITGLSRNTTYYYRVRAVDYSGGQSASSSVKSTTTHKCDVYYNDNGGSGGPGITDLASDWTLLSSVVTPTRKGYSFNGYYTALINGTQYYNASGSRTVIDTFDAYEMQLYAQWRIHYSTVTINANGGNYSGQTTITDKYGTAIRLNDPTNDDPTQVFLRWEISNDNATLIRGAGYTTYIFGPDETDVTVTAIWYNPSGIGCVSEIEQNVTNENLERVYYYTVTDNDKGITEADWNADSILLETRIKNVEENAAIQELLASESGSNVAVGYFDISVVKVINGTNETKLTELPEPTIITIELTGELAGKTGYAVYRVHNGVAERMSSSREQEEYYEITGGKVVIYTKKFSTYAVTSASSVIGAIKKDELTNENNYVQTDVQGKYSDGSNTAVYKIDIEWGNMQFIFDKHQVWNPETHSYNDEVTIKLNPSAYVDGNNEIVVTNHSNADVRVGMIISHKDIDGVEIMINQSNSSASDPAENMTLARVPEQGGTAPQLTAYVRFDEGMLNAAGLEKLAQQVDVYQRIAVVTITIEPLSSDLTPVSN